MERSGKRGKIPQQDWPSIIKRYEAGETLASIARTYDCSPPAISYILSRSRTRDLEQTTTETVGSQLVKGQVNEALAPRNKDGAPKTEEAAAPTREAPAPDLFSEVKRRGPPAGELKQYSNGETGALDIKTKIFLRETEGSAGQRVDDGEHNVPATGENPPIMVDGSGTPPQRAEPRRTLHLSLSQNGGQNSNAARHQGAGANMTERSPARTAGGNQELFRPTSAHHESATNDEITAGVAEPSKSRESGTFIDQALRDRVDTDISAFLAAFDAALADDTVENRAGLRQATDRLLRAGARTRIELERLEARVPLAARDHRGFAASSWRPR